MPKLDYIESVIGIIVQFIELLQESYRYYIKDLTTIDLLLL